MANDYDNDMADMEAYLDKIPGMPKAPRQQRSQQQGQAYPHNSHNAPTMDAETMLMQRIMQGNTTSDQMQGGGCDPYQQQQQTVRLREGATYYKMTPADMSDVPIAMFGGPITGVEGKEFILKHVKQYYLIENHLAAIDVSKIDRSKLKKMCAVEAPWTGVILVPESAVVNVGQNNGPQILKG
jgi:hypothetical protein